MTISHDDKWWQMTSSDSALAKHLKEKHSFEPLKQIKNIETGERVFDSGSKRDDDSGKPLVNHLDPYVRLRYGYLLRQGANKYGKNNWKLGQPTEAALESLHRHLAKFELGDVSEDHLSAIIFNVQLIMKNEEKQGVQPDHYFNERD